MSVDPFEGLARYYDPIMEHVNYDRWFDVCAKFARMLPPEFTHLDAGCGTGILIKHFRRQGWNSVGADISPAMLQQILSRDAQCPLVVADIAELPFKDSFDYITCLFDTINFLLSETAVEAAFKSFHTAMRGGGMLYFDYVTERLVLEHFADQEWNEDNGRFHTRWASDYDRNAKIAETRIRINSGPDYVLHERVYPDDFYVSALEKAGFTVLGVMDAENSRKPNKRTCRVDVFAAKQPTKTQVKACKSFLAGL